MSLRVKITDTGDGVQVLSGLLRGVERKTEPYPVLGQVDFRVGGKRLAELIRVEVVQGDRLGYAPRDRCVHPEGGTKRMFFDNRDNRKLYDYLSIGGYHSAQTQRGVN